MPAGMPIPSRTTSIHPALPFPGRLDESICHREFVAAPTALAMSMNDRLPCSLVCAATLFSGQATPSLYFETVALEHCEQAQGTKKKLLM